MVLGHNGNRSQGEPCLQGPMVSDAMSRSLFSLPRQMNTMLSRVLTIAITVTLVSALPARASNVLLVVDSVASMTAGETARQTQFEAWGHTVTVIEDSDSQANFDAAVTANDLAYINEEVASVSVGYKLREAPIPVLVEEQALTDEMGFATYHAGAVQTTSITIDDNTHPITSGFSTGSLSFTSSNQELIAFSGSYAPGATVLASIGSQPTFLVVEAGGQLANTYNGSNLAFGTRIKLPIGSSSFDWNTLTSDGLQLVQGTLAWAASDDGLVGHWKLDETSGTVALDSSGEGNDGSLVGSPTWVADTPRTHGLQVSSGDHVDAGNFAVTGSALSLSVWFYVETPSHDARLVIRSSGNVGSDQSWGLTTDETGELEFRLTAGGSLSRIRASGVIKPQQWYHAVGTYDGTTMLLYLDGQVIGTMLHTAGGAVDTDASHTVTIGDSIVGDRALDGKIDDVRVYGKALTEPEIAEVYGLIAHWKLDETSGTTAVDSSLSGHDATLTGSANWTGGKDGGAHESDYTDGTDDYFEAPSSTALDDVHKSNYTVMAYFKPNSVPPGSGSDNNASYGILIKEGNHIGLHYNASQQFQIDHLNAGGSWHGAGTFSTSYPPGAFYHVAGVVDYDAGTIKIYVDGVLAGSDTFTPGSSPEDYGSARWRLGIALPGSGSWRWPADGVIDDARIYNRALTDAEIAEYTSYGLVGHWELSEASGTIAVDSSAGANDGTYTNGVAVDQDEPYPGVAAPEFDGVDDHVVLAPINADFQNGLTIAAWIKPSTTLGSGQFHEIFEMSNGSEVDQILLSYSGVAGLQLFLTDTEDGAATHTIEDNTGFAAGRWVHCVATIDSSGEATLYRNGQVTKSGFFTSLPTNVLRSTATIGKSSFGDHFGGGLQDVRVYNYELSPAEIGDLYGLVGHWEFDEGSGTTIADSTGAASNAAFSTGTSEWIDGVRGYALEFDGTNDTQSEETIEPPATGAVVFWMRSDGPPTSRQRPWGIGSDFEVWQDTDGLVSMDLSTDGYQGGFITSEALHSESRWYHIVAQYDSDTESYEIYLDGQLHKSGVSTRDIQQQASNYLSFGTRTGSTQRFTGALDDFRIYNRWLSTAEIAEIYGLVGWWRMEEVSGSVVSDSSGAGNHGTAVGTPTWSGEAKESFGSIELDGTNYVEVPGLLFDGQSASLAGWAKLTQADSRGAEIVSLGDHIGIRLDSDTKGTQSWIYNGSNFDELESGHTHENSGWHHFATSFDERTLELKFYIDGVLQVSQTTTNVLTLSGQGDSTHIGQHGNGQANRDFTGLLDDIRVYNRTIRPEEVRTLFYGGYSPGLRIVEWAEVANP